MKATLHDCYESMTDGLVVSFRVNNDYESRREVARLCSELRAADLAVTVKKYTAKRSLNANSYMWVLLDKLAAKLNTGREELYRDYVRKYGKAETYSLPTAAVKTLVSAWEKQGLGWFAETTENRGVAIVRLYFGTSVYNKEEMARLIEQIVDDCKEMHIETKTPAEIEELMRLYEQADKSNKHTV